ncbi:MAG: hypothetical protein ACRC0G_07495 [Fusobacteriaceae bacterium]
MERKNEKMYSKPTGGRAKTFGEKPKVIEATFEKCKYYDFEKAVIYRIGTGELILDDAHAHLMLPSNLKELCEKIMEWHNNIVVPVRATIGSGGYDFATPVPVKIIPFKLFRIPTGIKAKMPFRQVLSLSSRSSIFGDQIIINGTIDSDYYFSKKTAGQIVIQGLLKTLEVNDDGTVVKAGPSIEYPEGHPLANGIFYEYKRVSNEKDNPVTKKRDGGFGHTNR